MNVALVLCLRTDSGSEFKSVVDKYMYDNNTLHLWALPDRHKQSGNVENLNKQLGRELRHYINDAKKHPKDVNLNKYVPPDINMDQPPKYKINDLVFRRLEVPIDKFGNRSRLFIWQVVPTKKKKITQMQKRRQNL